MMAWLKEYGAIVLAVLAVVITVGVYKNTVDDLKARVAKLEAQPRILNAPADPRLAECARLAKEAYGDGTRTEMDSRTDILMLRLGCNER
jgi:hypothetical protein